jgi:hypothetical protein
MGNRLLDLVALESRHLKRFIEFQLTVQGPRLRDFDARVTVTAHRRSLFLATAKRGTVNATVFWWTWRAFGLELDEAWSFVGKKQRSPI